VSESRFLTELVARLPLGDGDAWVLDAPLIFESARHGRIVVPAHTETDFASVPRLPLAYLLTGNTAHYAAAVHDYLYSRARLPREQADEIFLEAMEACGVPGWRRRLMYAGVRLGGRRRYGTPPAEGGGE